MLRRSAEQPDSSRRGIRPSLCLVIAIAIAMAILIDTLTACVLPAHGLALAREELPDANLAAQAQQALAQADQLEVPDPMQRQRLDPMMDSYDPAAAGGGGGGGDPGAERNPIPANDAPRQGAPKSQGKGKDEPINKLIMDQGTSYTAAMVLTLVSGLSTGLGGVVVVCLGEPTRSTMGFLEGIAAGVMIYLSVFDLLFPSVELIGLLHAFYSFVCGCVGFGVLSAILEAPIRVVSKIFRSSFGASQGALTAGTGSFTVAANVDPATLRTAIMTAAVVSLHNMPEGAILLISTLRGLRLGFVLAVSLALHNVPEGMSIAAPIYAATKSVPWSLVLPVVSGLFEPLGALVASLLLQMFSTGLSLQYLLAGVGGIMFVLSVVELGPLAVRHIGQKRLALASIIIGMLLCAILVRLTEALLEYNGIQENP
ncbi:hypothetical protein CAOG_05723 [Capsaspora owczarzaki ATCC 30864]|uniref:Uncharacterized protein n=1 Tax=Capsaspora owczarzaki (strain ATCC 30864) TaxID=595528 RepID=A0A0D2X411_CAPO3|nr:hypothetical protein CAOG_05723 [Capsaspora owczarzaki ATCC 30864]KJE95249.1 hypothetical protein CAOG_005723 [Capsaspora owczarzaki ATCC 30864]|eukprot:XP_004346396.2 hypothetical protein CAOG_05723 [Capsaspora owczarzaki ATCC 30864]